MGDLKIVGVKELKNNLSAYLRDVRRGTRVLVSDRDRVVAELCEPRTAYGLDVPDGPRLAEWVRRGVVALSTATKAALPVSPVQLPDGTAARLLDEDRGQTA